MEKQIDLTVNNKEFNFIVELGDFHSFINEMGDNNKVQPAYAFVTRTIKHDQKDELIKLINDNPGLELELAGFLVTEYKPKVSVIVGKPKAAASK